MRSLALCFRELPQVVIGRDRRLVRVIDRMGCHALLEDLLEHTKRWEHEPKYPLGLVLYAWGLTRARMDQESLQAFLCALREAFEGLPDDLALSHAVPKVRFFSRFPSSK